MKKITKYAREHRRNPTKAEAELKRKLLNWKIRFRSQRPYSHYIVDFLIPEKLLIIEVDGKYHEKTQEYDLKRQTYLESLGFTVIRFTNEHVLGTNCEDIKQIILDSPTFNIKGMDWKKVYGQAKY